MEIDDKTFKSALSRQLPRLTKLMITMASSVMPVEVSIIRELARDAGLREVDKWNVSDILSNSGGKAIRTRDGWELTEEGKHEVRQLLGLDHTTKADVAVDLRAEMTKITDEDTLAFCEEAIRCYEAKLYRSAIVMSWLAAVDVLYAFVVANKLTDFNTEAKRVNSDWKKAVNRDDLALMNERQFLDRLAAISVIGKNVKTDLIVCLDKRNGCGHPNSLKIGRNAVAAHIETLILNVFQKFA